MNHASAPLAGGLSEPEGRHLASEEVLEQLDSLPDEDKRRPKLIELRRLSGTDFSEGLLYQEAVCQESRERSTRRRALRAGRKAPCLRGGAGAARFAAGRRQEKAQAHRAAPTFGHGLQRGPALSGGRLPGAPRRATVSP